MILLGIWRERWVHGGDETAKYVLIAAMKPTDRRWCFSTFFIRYFRIKMWNAFLYILYLYRNVDKYVTM